MDDEAVAVDDEGDASWKEGGRDVGVGSVPMRLIGTPTAGKRASLTFRLVLRASQPITMSKMSFSGFCDAVDGECRRN